ncbi:hypothetical protein [Aquimarina sp. SS2-1]|uniref:hypothetical protein n=1 Tax=Aquimarina besae TaxID=3342247 RepID=UPI0036720912
MKYINTIIILYSFFFSGEMNAQQTDLDKAKVIIEKVKNFYDNQSKYQVNVNYTLFDGLESTSILESYEGVIVKNDQNFYSKIHNTESLQISENYVKVNHDEKAVMYGKADEKNKPTTALNLELLFRNFNKAIIKEKEALYIIEMMAPSISQSPYRKVVLKITKNDFRLEKQILFFSSTIPVKTQNGNEKLTNPRLEVVFTNFSQNDTEYQGKFNFSSFVLLSKTGNRISPNLKHYQFIDTTRQ